MKNTKKPLLYIISIGALYYAFASLYLIISIFVIMIQTSGQIDVDFLTEKLVNQTFIGTIFAQISTLMLCLVLLYKEKIKYFLQFKKLSIKLVIVSFLVGVTMVFISQHIIDFLSVLFPNQAQHYNEQSVNLFQISPWLLIIPIVVMAPLLEEVLYRGIFFRVFKKEGVGAFWMISLSALVFGLAHMDLFQSTYAFVIGIILALSFYWTKNIWVPIIIHFSNNMLAVILMYDRPIQFVNENTQLIHTFSYFLMFGILPISLYFMFLKRQKEIEVIEDEPYVLSSYWIRSKDIPKFRLMIMFSMMMMFIALSLSIFENAYYLNIFIILFLYMVYRRWYISRPLYKLENIYKEYGQYQRFGYAVKEIEGIESEPLSLENKHLITLFKVLIWMPYNVSIARTTFDEISHTDSQTYYFQHVMIEAILALFEKSEIAFSKVEKEIYAYSSKHKIKKKLRIIIKDLEVFKNIHLLDEIDHKILMSSRFKYLPKTLYHYLLYKYYALLNDHSNRKMFLSKCYPDANEMQSLRLWIIESETKIKENDINHKIT